MVSGVLSQLFFHLSLRGALSDDRTLINGILYVVATGCRWRKMPRKYGSYVTAWRRLQEAGVWDKIIESLSSMRGRECSDRWRGRGWGVGR